MLGRGALWACVCVALLGALFSGGAAGLQAQTYPASQTPATGDQKEPAKEKEGPKLSDGERKAAIKINTAADPAAKLQAAGEFVKKYPKSEIRGEIAGYVAEQITTVQDNAQKAALAETFRQHFNGAGEADLVIPALVDSYLASNRLEEAFNLAAPWLTKDTDQLRSLVVLVNAGTNDATRNSGSKFLKPAQQYAIKAIGIIEADTKPADLNDATWSSYKTTFLPQLYQALGVLSLISGDSADALTKLEASATLNKTNPVNYSLIGNIKNSEYQQLAQKYKSTPSDELLKEANAKLDEVILLYAQAAAHSAGDPQYKSLYDQVMQDLTAYYKYRHNNSTDGMQQMIDKYKAAPAPK